MKGFVNIDGAVVMANCENGFNRWHKVPKYDLGYRYLVWRNVDGELTPYVSKDGVEWDFAFRVGINLTEFNPSDIVEALSIIRPDDVTFYDEEDKKA